MISDVTPIPASFPAPAIMSLRDADLAIYSLSAAVWSRAARMMPLTAMAVPSANWSSKTRAYLLVTA